MGTPRTLKGRIKAISAQLAVDYPEALCELDHRNAFELLVATILSAQTTDTQVNMVTPALFAKYPNAAALAAAVPAELEEIIRSTGFYNSKARSLMSMAHSLLGQFGGEVPTAREDLVTLAGVGRKTANVVRSVAFGLPGLPVDTHVGRLTRKWALTDQEDPVKVEAQLCALLAPADWGDFSLRTILHGRRVCDAKKPRCAECHIEPLCPASLLPRSPSKRVAGAA